MTCERVGDMTQEVFTGCLFLCLVVDMKVKRFKLCKKLVVIISNVALCSVYLHHYFTSTSSVESCFFVLYLYLKQNIILQMFFQCDFSSNIKSGCGYY